jgi:hypothetical protein
MSLSEVARYEWAIMLLIPLGLLLWELRSIRREIRRAREAEARKRQR